MKVSLEEALDLARKQKDCEFSFGFILKKENDNWKNYYAIVKLIKKGSRNEFFYDYGDYVVREKLLSFDVGIEKIKKMYPKEESKGTLNLFEYGEFTIDSISQSDFTPSKNRYWTLKSNYPMRIFSFNVSTGESCRNARSELLKNGLPYFPRLEDAVLNVFELGFEKINPSGQIIVAIIDYRAKIESLKLIRSKVEVKLNSPEIQFNDLSIKAFANRGATSIVLEEQIPKSDIVAFDVGFQPDSLNVVMITRKDSLKVDSKEFSKFRSEEEGIFIERPGDEIISLAKAGESENLEYKGEVFTIDNKVDLAETVVAFSNSSGGIILVGVTDTGDVLGSHASKDDLLKSIHDRCDPPPKEITAQETTIDDKKIIVIEVSEGSDKPYQSKGNKIFFVRHGSTDMRMERSELMQIWEEKRESQSSGISGYGY